MLMEVIKFIEAILVGMYELAPVYVTVENEYRN